MALDFVGGCFGGFAGILVGHPFDTVKVRLQSQDAGRLRYKGTIDCFSQIIKQESIHGLYKGMASPVVGQVFINALVFGVQGNTLRRLKDKGVKGHFISGAVAGGVQTLLCSPLELVKTRMQLQGLGETRKQLKSHLRHSDRYSYKSPIECIEKIYKYEGVRGCFRGLFATFVREVPSFGVYFASYFSLCKYLNANKGTFNIPKLFVCGGLSGMVTWLVTYPVDVVKTRLQADGVGTSKYRGIIDCCRKSYQKGGYQVFFRGLNATLIRAFPTNAATLATVTIFLEAVQPEILEDFFEPEDHYNYEHVRPGWSI